MSAFLAKLRTSGALPARVGQAYPPTPGNEAVPPALVARFNTLQDHVFGRHDLIALASCQDCEALSEYALKTIFIQPSAFRSWENAYGSAAKPITDFVLAHEISHFVHEASLGASGIAHVSLNGYGSLLFPDSSIKSENAGTWGHAEVDAYALLILSSFGSSWPQPVLRFIRDFRDICYAKPDRASWFEGQGFEIRYDSARTIIGHLYPGLGAAAR